MRCLTRDLRQGPTPVPSHRHEEPSPDAEYVAADPDDEAGGKTYRDYLNPASVRIVTARLEASLAKVVPETRFQFERLGYFVADRKDHRDDRPVFNRICTLRDSWAKAAK